MYINRFLFIFIFINKHTVDTVKHTFEQTTRKKQLTNLLLHLFRSLFSLPHSIYVTIHTYKFIQLHSLFTVFNNKPL